MPPKKKARVSQAASPAATDQQHKTPTPAPPQVLEPVEGALRVGGIGLLVARGEAQGIGFNPGDAWMLRPL